MKGAKSATFRFVVAETFFEDAKIAHHGTEIDDLQRMHPPLRLGCMRLCRPCPLAKATKNSPSHHFVVSRQQPVSCD